MGYTHSSSLPDKDEEEEKLREKAKKQRREMGQNKRALKLKEDS